MFVPLDKVAIPKTNFTLTVAVETVVQMDAIHNFDWIYVDRGFGEMQVEQLHLYGKQHPHTGLHKKVIGVSFSEKISVRDPYTKQKDSKEVKPFMVNNSVNLFEKGMVALEPRDTQVREQLEQYVIKSISPLGRPTYSGDNDHFVDALHLCMLGFALKYDDMIKVQLAKRIATLNLIGESGNKDNEPINLEDAGRHDSIYNGLPNPNKKAGQSGTGFGIKSFGQQRNGGRTSRGGFTGRKLF